MRSELADGPDASQYDGWFERPWGHFAFDVERHAVLKAVGLLSDQMLVLDVGSGTGRFTAELEKNGAVVVGLDLDPEMLRIASPRTEGHVILADAHHTPFPGGTFDRVMAVTLCEFAGDPEAILAELARVTRPGGRIVVGRSIREAHGGCDGSINFGAFHGVMPSSCLGQGWSTSLGRMVGPLSAQRSMPQGRSPDCGYSVRSSRRSVGSCRRSGHSRS